MCMSSDSVHTFSASLVFALFSVFSVVVEVCPCYCVFLLSRNLVWLCHSLQVIHQSWTSGCLQFGDVACGAVNTHAQVCV